MISPNKSELLECVQMFEEANAMAFKNMQIYAKKIILACDAITREQNETKVSKDMEEKINSIVGEPFSIHVYETKVSEFKRALKNFKNDIDVILSLMYADKTDYLNTAKNIEKFNFGEPRVEHILKLQPALFNALTDKMSKDALNRGLNVQPLIFFRAIAEEGKLLIERYNRYSMLLKQISF